MIIDCISDLHGHHPELEGGDLLIIAGDLTANNTLDQINRLKDWLIQIATPIYKKTVMVAGNHDNWIQRREFFNGDIDSWEHKHHSYLEDSGTEFEGLKMWGSPWTKTFPGMNPHCKAFTVDTEEELAKKWELIPQDTDILITHSPPHGIFDTIKYPRKAEDINQGSISLLMKATSLANLKLFIWGHIHESYGIFTPKELIDFSALKIAGNYKCKSFPYLINASHVNERYEPVNKPIRVIL